MLKTIEDVCQLLNGYSFKSKKYVDSGIRIIRIANVQKGFIEDNTPAFYPLETPGIENYMLKEGDLLISLTGNVGRVALLNKEMLPAALNQRVACLRIKDDSIYKKFLFHYLNSSKFENTCILESRGVAQKNMSTEWLKRQPIPNYTLQNQIKISKILDSIIEIINKKRQQLVEFDSLIKSRFVEMFGDPITNNKGWDVKDLNEITDVRDGTHDSPKYVDIGYPFVTSKNLVNGNIDFSTCQLISKDDLEKINQRSFVDDGDILMPMIGTIGGAIIVKKDRDFAIKNVALIKFNKENSIVDRKFILNVLNSDSMNEFFNSIKKGGTQNFISLGLIRKIPTIIPPLKLQNEFALFVEQVDKLKFAVQKSLDETQTLFDSLMQKYFG